MSLAFSPCGKFLASGSSDENIRIFDINNNKLYRIYHEKNGGHTGVVNSVTFSPCGRFLASGSCDKSVNIFDIINNKLYDKYIYIVDIRDVKFSPCGKFLAIASLDNPVKIFIRIYYHLLSSAGD